MEQFSTDDIDTAVDNTSLATPGNSVLSSANTELEQKFHEVCEENRVLKAQNQTNEILNSLIKPYARRTFIFMCFYCIVVFGITISEGLDLIDLDTSVIEYLVGSTAVTVIGLVGMILTGVFVGARRKL